MTLALVVIGSRILIPPPLPPWSPFLVQTDICLFILFVELVLPLRLPFPAFLVQSVGGAHLKYRKV